MAKAQDEKIEEKDADKKQKAKRRKGAQKKEAPLIAKSKRKEAIAIAYIRSGNGKLTINGIPVSLITPEEIRGRMLEPIYVSDDTKKLASTADIEVNVKHGGISSQANAARCAIAKAIAEFSKNPAIKAQYLAYDRSMIVDDPRRVEPKKYKGPKARARFQTSYR